MFDDLSVKTKIRIILIITFYGTFINKYEFLYSYTGAPDYF